MEFASLIVDSARDSARKLAICSYSPIIQNPNWMTGILCPYQRQFETYGSMDTGDVTLSTASGDCCYTAQRNPSNLSLVISTLRPPRPEGPESKRSLEPRTQRSKF